MLYANFGMATCIIIFTIIIGKSQVFNERDYSTYYFSIIKKLHKMLKNKLLFIIFKGMTRTLVNDSLHNPEVHNNS